MCRFSTGADVGAGFETADDGIAPDRVFAFLSPVKVRDFPMKTGIA